MQLYLKWITFEEDAIFMLQKSEGNAHNTIQKLMGYELKANLKGSDYKQGYITRKKRSLFLKI